MSEDIETKKETIREMSNKIDEIRFEMQELIDWYSEEMEKINKYEYENAEKAFSIYIEHGITIGTKFRFDGKPEIYTVIGICPDGFRCSRPDAEIVGRSTTLLPAKDPDLIKEKINLVQIIPDDETPNAGVMLVALKTIAESEIPKYPLEVGNGQIYHEPCSQCERNVQIAKNAIGESKVKK